MPTNPTDRTRGPLTFDSPPQGEAFKDAALMYIADMKAKGDKIKQKQEKKNKKKNKGKDKKGKK